MEGFLQGQSLGNYADNTKKSINTVRTQLKQILAKTGHTRQTDLIRDLLSNAILLMARNSKANPCTSSQ